jgi:hypothetical protein
MFFAQILFDELLQSGLDVPERLIDVLPCFGTREHDLARGENQQTDFGTLHVVNQTGKSVGVEVAEHFVVALEQPLELDFEIHRARPDHVLDFEVRELDVVARALDGFCVGLGGVETQLLALGACDDHFARFEDEGGRARGLFHAHDDRGESLWIVFRISAFEGDVFQIQLTFQVRCRNQVLQLRRLKLGNLRS